MSASVRVSARVRVSASVSWWHLYGHQGVLHDIDHHQRLIPEPGGGVCVCVCVFVVCNGNAGEYVGGLE